VRKTMQAASTRKIASEPRIPSKPRLASFYDKADILRNKIERRPLPPRSLQVLKGEQEKPKREKSLSFFT
jgi:hypothetical protein